MEAQPWRALRIRNWGGHEESSEDLEHHVARSLLGWQLCCAGDRLQAQKLEAGEGTVSSLGQLIQEALV